ncbi:MAG TPA: glycosyltransferase, partial [Gemmatimonadaceae bacterium]|nr:glycosyltransferase [Gemmatimonadaceae bacterium]
VRVDAWERKSNLELLRLVDEVRPQLLLVIDTTGVRPGTLGQIRARCPDTALHCVFPDSPHSLDIERIAALPLFDRVGTSSPAWVDVFRRLGARHAAYLPFAADTELHVPGGADAARKADVCFVGTWRPEREAFLEQLSDLDLRIWGSDYWKTRTRPSSPLRARWAGRPLRGEELGAVCASTRVMLNVMDVATWPGPNMRTFEQAACGAFSLTTRTPAVLELFTEGENIECFDDVREARAKIERYLRDDERRARVARAGLALVTTHHTYAHRIATLTDWLAADAAHPDHPRRAVAH